MPGRASASPSLQQFLQTIPPQITIFIEIKDPAAAESVAAQVAQAVAHGGWRYAQLPIITFKRAVLTRIRAIDNEIALGVSCSRITMPVLAAARRLRAQSVIPNIRYLTPAAAAKAQAQGLSAHCWTCNTTAAIAKARHSGADGVIGDDVELLRQDGR